uniref:Uncharacterized protein n=1 Tax=Arundo donax TaxID=35708 RepID=A0A0A9FSL0_ARUDO
MRRGLEFHSASASSTCSGGATTSSACAILLRLQPAPPIPRVSPPPELNAASPSLLLLPQVPCPLYPSSSRVRSLPPRVPP